MFLPDNKHFLCSKNTRSFTIFCNDEELLIILAIQHIHINVLYKTTKSVSKPVCHPISAMQPNPYLSICSRRVRWLVHQERRCVLSANAISECCSAHCRQIKRKHRSSHDWRRKSSQLGTGSCNDCGFGLNRSAQKIATKRIFFFVDLRPNARTGR